MENEAVFERQLKELLKEFGPLPEPAYEKIVDFAIKSQNNHQQLKDSISKLQDSLDYLRFSIKYLIFDLEATRRENAYLKSLLQKME